MAHQMKHMPSLTLASALCHIATITVETELVAHTRVAEPVPLSRLNLLADDTAPRHVLSDILSQWHIVTSTGTGLVWAASGEACIIDPDNLDLLCDTDKDFINHGYVSSQAKPQASSND
jgi:hypothetical protein